jgi:hypothetical protein
MNQTYKIKRENLPDDNPSQIDATIKKMIELARRDSKSPAIRKIASKIFTECNNNELCMAEAAYDYVYEKIGYQFDDKVAKNYLSGDTSNVEFVASPKYLADPNVKDVKKIGDCDDMATLLCSIYLALGMRTRLRVIAWKSDEFTHVYSEAGVYIDDEGWWVPSDPVIKQFGVEKAPVKNAKSYEV